MKVELGGGYLVVLMRCASLNNNYLEKKQNTT